MLLHLPLDLICSCSTQKNYPASLSNYISFIKVPPDTDSEINMDLMFLIPTTARLYCSNHENETYWILMAASSNYILGFYKNLSQVKWIWHMQLPSLFLAKFNLMRDFASSFCRTEKRRETLALNHKSSMIIRNYHSPLQSWIIHTKLSQSGTYSSTDSLLANTLSKQ